MLTHYVFVVATLSVALGLVSRTLVAVPVTEPMLGLAVGIALGPIGVGFLEVPDAGRGILFPLTRVLLSFTVMTTALRYPWTELRRCARSAAVMIGVVLPLMAATGALLAWGVLDVRWGTAVLLGAVLAPTVPVLVSSLVAGEAAEEALPAPVRQTTSVESAGNDGVGLFFVLFAFAVVGDTSWGTFASDAIKEIAGGIGVGLAAGFVAGPLVRRTRGGQLTEPTFMLFTLTFSLFVLGACTLIHVDGILAVFVAGVAYNRGIGEDNRRAQSTIEEGIDRLLLLPVFVILGVMVPWSAWKEAGWAAVAFVLAMLVLRRLPWLVLVGPLLAFPLRARVWMGWFGPVGVAALFYTLLGEDHGETRPIVWTIATLTVVSSAFVHGVTALPGRSWARHWTATKREHRGS